MIKSLIKYRILLIILVLIWCLIFVDSPYYGNNYGNPPVHIYFFVTFINLLIYLIPTDKLILAEKIFYAFLVSILTLLGGGLFVEAILGKIYGYDPFHDELLSPPLLANLLFYFVTNFSGILIFVLWLKYKKPIYQ
ncbi:hypothetical protein J2X31_001801 [Flavobacterium arsenatis]|uniref:Uncharacterized protein n=1 Tax=Flavobacterium arsenatis TaxID=1484332 RepID=A0ABU1TP87_9FLAO|nr:hypothetical protein [Flavobacterium arsenatis]MDR6967789.1 hypothetical protein [Flavobacterium arsenatis]